MKRRWPVRALGGAVVAAAVVGSVWAALTPPEPAAVLPTGTGWSPGLVRGAYHVHSLESDGTGSIAEIGEAAAAAGLDFVIITDHGDGTRPVRAPRYYHGVLCIEAVELSSAHGHYAALDLPVTPYPLGGDGRDVVADVDRFGGFGIAAHPDSAKRDLQWREWQAPFPALEWFNGDSQWRDEPRWRLVPTLIRYFRRPTESVAALFDRPDPLIEQWDTLTRQRSVVALAGHDAHQRLGLRSGNEPGEQQWYLRTPSYEHVFRTFTMGVELPHPLTENAATDAPMLIGAIRQGRVFTAIDAVASPARFGFTIQVGQTTARMGDRLPLTGPAAISVRSNSPDDATLVLRRDGREVDRRRGATLDYLTDRPGVYRVEIAVPSAPGHPPIPWILSNPIYLGVEPVPASQPPTLAYAPWTPAGSWAAEHDQGTTAHVRADGPGGVTMDYQLAGAASPFAAAVMRDTAAFGSARGLSFRLSADAPMRVSVQLRAASNDPDARWMRSVYADRTPRVVTILLAEFRPVVDGLAPSAPLDALGAVLFVVDRTNARPGTKGQLRIEDVHIGR